MSRSNQATANHNDVRQELNALKDDLMTLRSDLGRTANAAIDGGREACNHLADKAAEEINHGVDAARETVSHRPLTAMAVAAGVGVLLGALICRR